VGELRDHHALEDDEALAACQAAVLGGHLHAHQGHLYLPDAWRTESWLADDVVRVLSAPVTPITPAEAPGLTEEQSWAVALGCRGALTVITGGPGTGKTTTLTALLESLEAAGLETVLCAPTGKAASRMTQSTGRPATTLHRLLGYDGKKFENGLLPGDVYVVDETSMASNPLLGALMRSIPDGTRVVLVGDEDQLPPIDPGHPLAALTRAVPTARLTRTHRQASNSPILTLARQLISGEVPTRTGVPFQPAQNAQDVVRLVQAQLGEDGPMTVLTAGRAGPLGVDALNTALQDALNPGDARLREGDPVMATRNNHDTGLMNGMTGRVVRMTARETTCVFEDVEYTFSPARLSELTLAYAMTIHRSQGSEWPGVLVVLTGDHERLLSRQLAYTAVTRARTHLIASGEREAWAYAAQTGAPRRHSLLGALLQ